MRIVLDTNVLVAGLLTPFGPPGEIVRMTSAGSLQLGYDARILSEYKSVLHRPKFNFNIAHVNALLDQIKASGCSVTSLPLKRSLPDAGDEPFLQVALAADAACLVTGNLKHYPAAVCQKMEVLSPANFLQFYRTHHQK